ATGYAEPWEKATDKDWVDPRFREMNTGQFLNCTMRYPLGKGQETVYKATVVKLTAASGGREPPVTGAVVFDRCTMRLAAGWTGGYLNHTDRRFGLLNTPTPKGDMVFASPAGPGWAASDGNWEPAWRSTRPLPKDWAKYRGLYLRDDRVILSYTVDGTEILDALEFQKVGDVPVIARTIEVGPGEHPLEIVLAETKSDWRGGGKGGGNTS